MKAKFLDFEISAQFTGKKAATWLVNNQPNWNHHIVTVKRGRKQVQFDFWASIASPQLKTVYDLLNAFYCFVSDAIYYEQPEEQMDKETWKALENANKKLHRFYEGDIYDLARALQEVAG